jgi:hypothetical protein
MDAATDDPHDAATDAMTSEPCAEGEHLDGDRCVADACPGECEHNATRCADGALRRCIPSGECWAWTTPASCGAAGCDGERCTALGPGVSVQQWGTDESDTVYGLAMGAGPELLVVGAVWGSLDGALPAGSSDTFLASRGPDAGSNWSRQRGTSGRDVANAVARLSTGEIFVGGEAAGSLETGAGGLTDLFVTKWSSSGEYQWDARWGATGPMRESLLALELGPGGTIYAAGATEGDIDGDGGDSHAGSFDAFLTRLNADGGVVWSRQWGDQDYDAATGVALGSGGELYLVGYTEGDLDGQDNAGARDAFVQRRAAADGDVVWTVLLGSGGSDEARAVWVSASDEIFVTGHAGGDLGGGGTGGAFLAKLAANGDVDWVEQWGPGGTRPWALEPGTDGELFVGGATTGSIDGQQAAGDDDAFVSKWTYAGQTRDRPWSRQVGTAETEGVYGLAVHPGEAVYVGGATFGAFPGYTLQGEADLFVVRLEE